MTLTEHIERHLALKLSHTEKIYKQIFGLYANEHTPNIFKSTTLVSASNERVYICTLRDDNFYCEEINYEAISAVYHRKRILSGLEMIIYTKNKRISISHIEEGCPIELTQFIQNKKLYPFSTIA